MYIREIKDKASFSSDIDLVLLSACNSGVSDINSAMTGAEYITIAGAFLEKVPTLMATLWPLSDESAPILIENFYSRLKSNHKKDEALQQAMNQLLRNEEFENPFYWAPFVLMGDFK